MSGHSKWSTIKRKKAVVDAKRGKLFTKATREIIIAVKSGGDNPEMNARLRLAISKAKEVNMPNDNIKRAIQKAAGSGEGGSLEEVTYEAYAQDGVALIIECVTDNKNRTLPEIKNMITKSGGNMAEKGAVSYMFNQRGLFLFEAGMVTEDAVMEVALEFDVEDIKTSDDGSIEVICQVTDFEALKEAFDHAKFEISSAEITMLPETSIPIAEYETARKVLTLVNKLDDYDDVQNVYGNYELAEELFERLEAEGLV